MDFVSLFDPETADEPVNCRSVHSWEENGNYMTKAKSGSNLKRNKSFNRLPPEPQLGNIEYKLKLISPTRQRFEHLVTQMKWRLREGAGEAIYEIGVEDSGILRGLTKEEMKMSLETLNQMALKLGATTTVLRESIVSSQNDINKTVAEVLIRKVPDDQTSIDLRVAVMGNADAGKSTLLGVLTQGELDDGRGRARLNMFRHLHEIQTGRTSSISHEILGFDSQGRTVNYQEGSSETICEMSTKLVTLIDLAGHQKYLRTTIRGVTGYSPHYILFALSSGMGYNQTVGEHLSLALALEIPLIVVVAKIDLVPTSKLEKIVGDVESHLKRHFTKRKATRLESEDDVITFAGSQPDDTDVPILCVSSVSGLGIPFLTKLLHLLPPGINPKERERLEQELPEFQIDETFRIPEKGTILGGLLTQGIVTEGTSLLLGPLMDGSFHPVSVKTIRRHKTPCRAVKASQSASIGLNIQVPGLRKGMVLVSPDQQPSATLFFQADISVLYHATAITKGFQTTVHIGNVRQTAIVEEIFSVPRICTNERAIVVFRFIKHPEYIKVGARLLFREGMTKGVGTVAHLYPYQPPISYSSFNN